MVIAVIAGALLLLFGWIWIGYYPTAGLETSHYTVVGRAGDYELREYGEFLMAETECMGSLRQALTGGFQHLFDYVSGANSSREQVRMTVPINEKKGKRIAMTTPLVAEVQEGNRYLVSFLVPSRYTLETSPRPDNPAVWIRLVAKQRCAVLTFSGFVGEHKVTREWDRLRAMLVRDGLQVRGKPRLAIYNPPWTPPFMRRNEIIADLV